MLKKFIFTLFLLIFFFHTSFLFSETLEETRAIWVKLEHLISKERIDKLINTAKNNHINLIFAQVRRLGVLLYPSNFEKTSSLVAGNFDPLDYLISRAHQEKIEVHAWINTFFVWSKSMPEQEGHVIQNKDWLLKNVNYGNMIFLNPLKPAVQNHLLNLISELVLNYPVDGIHLDYIRYPLDQNDGFTEFLAENFEPNLPKTTESWVKYRRQQLTEFIRKISETVSNINPQIKISAAVIPDITEATYFKGQDWPNWLNEGLLDFVVLMCYSKNWETIKKQVSSAFEAVKNRYFVVGIGSYLLSAWETSNQIKLLRKFAEEKNSQNFIGFSLFSYETYQNQPTGLEYLKKTVFNDLTKLPELPWKKKNGLFSYLDLDSSEKGLITPQPESTKLEI